MIFFFNTRPIKLSKRSCGQRENTSRNKMLTRLPDWQKRLSDLIVSRMQKPFVWGSNDCCLFAADAVLAVTGVDLARDERGRYGDRAGSQSVLKGVGGLFGAAGRAGTRIDPSRAIEGDVGLVRVGKPVLAVRISHVWMAPAAWGLNAMPVAVVAWGIGHA